MGLIRKAMSVSTGGMVDFRSDKERIARSTRKTSKESKKQTELMERQLEAQERAAQAQERAARAQQNAVHAPIAKDSSSPITPAAMPAGWYQVDGVTKWWDGQKRAEVTPVPPVS